MRQEFSTLWNSSTQVRKQRKFRHNAPLHIRQKFMSSHLSKELRKKHGIRNIAVRKGDEVLVMKGSFAKKKAKVTEVDLKKTRVVLDGITRTKKDGSKTPVYFKPHTIQIITLNVDDKKRLGGKNAPNKV